MSDEHKTAVPKAVNDPDILYCAKHQVFGGLSVCTELQLPCLRAIKAGKCPLGYKV